MSEQTMQVSLTVNGVPRRAEIPVRRTLSDVLRVDLGLTGTHVGCEHGVCGACTVLLDGEPVRSCLMLGVTADGHEITTVEGLSPDDGSLSPAQQGFVDCHGLQCGFCTPGFLTTVTAFIAENPDPTEDEAREAVGGNLCRCTGYHNIVASVMRAAELARGQDSGAEPGHTGGSRPDSSPGPGQTGDAGGSVQDSAAEAGHGGSRPSTAVADRSDQSNPATSTPDDGDPAGGARAATEGAQP
ncbi:(2Fe-2S)-binding protein [Pseudactinotalea sp. Z1739]|uniref:(2Fe-2S)-binding protein n=1 Tax=Pseudactinotalea sp. Z1739 TaxID=3413028 RepID=UPI003C7D9E1C